MNYDYFTVLKIYDSETGQSKGYFYNLTKPLVIDPTDAIQYANTYNVDDLEFVINMIVSGYFGGDKRYKGKLVPFDGELRKIKLEKIIYNIANNDD